MVMCKETLDGLVVLEHRVRVQVVFEDLPCVAQQVLARRSVQHEKILNLSDDLLNLKIAFGHEQMMNLFLEFPD